MKSITRHSRAVLIAAILVFLCASVLTAQLPSDAPIQPSPPPPPSKAPSLPKKTGSDKSPRDVPPMESGRATPDPYDPAKDPRGVVVPANALQSGPMVCYSEMREVMLWVQTTTSAWVRVQYWEKGNPGSKYATQPVMTSPTTAFTAHLIADSVLPGKRYEYELLINNVVVRRPYPLEFQSQRLWQWRESPPDFSVAVGSCAYINDSAYDRPGKPYGGSSEIFRSIYNVHPDVMLWMGDNIYLREADWYTRTGIFFRYTHGRSIPELQPLLGSTHHYAIWDDHDYGPNDADRGYRDKLKTLEAFKLFWGNPTYGTEKFGGICTTFEWGDVQFFLLDDRWERSPDNRVTGKRQILGDEQIEWLMDNLVYSKARFKVIAIGGQSLNPAARYENYATYAEERAKLLKLIADEKVKGVFFLSGDRHICELSKMPREGTYPLYDLTASPLTSDSRPDSSEPNTYRVPGTFVGGKQSFCVLSFSGKGKDRMMTITTYDTAGKELWKRSVMASEIE